MITSSAALTPSEWSLEDCDRLYLDNLLADEVTRGLGAAEADELKLLLRCARTGAPTSDPVADDDPLLEELHHTAAVAELCLIARRRTQAEGVPSAQVSAIQMPATIEADLRVLAKEEAKRLQEGRVLPFSQVAVYQPGLSPAWWVAAAATFLAALAWWPRSEAPDDVPGPAVVAETSVAPEPVSPIENLAETLTLALAPTEDPSATGASGTVLWNAALQRGEMRIVGLAVNDPSEYQYQLWIFDAQRDERYPVDGGIFDIDGSSVIVAVTPPVPVTEATLFAITVEPPGGVVVSKRERIALIASPEATA